MPINGSPPLAAATATPNKPCASLHYNQQKIIYDLTILLQKLRKNLVL